MNHTADKGWTPIYYVAENGHLNSIQLLVDLQADVNVPDGRGITSVTLSSQEGQRLTKHAQAV